MSEKEDDFTYYCRMVVRHMKSNRAKYPTFHWIMDSMTNDEAIDLIILAIGALCVYYFDKSIVITEAAKQVEKCALNGALTARLLLVQTGETVH